MCGIFGFVGPAADAVQPHATDEVLHTLRHRGPDALGQEQRSGANLAHARLSILDLSECGRQPMPNEDETLWLVFNGEIYNYRPLRDELKRKGHRFRSETDSEVLLHLYEEEGPAMVRRLRGMFAFALYDERRKELFAARDPFGIKPFFYAEVEEGVAFSSELRALASTPQFPRAMDWDAFGLYARLNYIPAPKTIWKAAKQLEPGHWLRARDGRLLEKKSYFTLEKTEGPTALGEALDAVDQTLRASVQSHLVSDVPVGAFLSGGLDSSLVAAMAQRELDEPLNTFTVTFPDLQVFDESGYAQQVATHIGSNHRELPVSADVAQAAITEMLEHLDEPFADSSLIPAAIVSKATSKHVKVALAGDGGDEMFAGYNKYQGLRLAESLNLLRPVLQAVAKLPIPEHHGSMLGKRWRQLRKLSRVMAPTAFERYVRATELVGDSLLAVTDGHPSLQPVADGGASKAQVRDQLRALWEQASEAGFDHVDQWLYADARFGLPYDMLHKVDRASMRYGLEVRVPFIDREVAQVAFSLPEKWKLNGSKRKWILSKVAERYLPDEVIYRPKQGFGFPIGEWVRTSLRGLFDETLAPERLAASGIWDVEAVHRLYQEHLDRRKDRYRELWSILVFETWREKWQPDLT